LPAAHDALKALLRPPKVVYRRCGIIDEEPFVITRRTFALSGLVLAVSGSARAAGPDPVAIVKSIYDGTLKTVAKDRAPWLDARDRPATLSRSLVALWKQAEDKVNPKGDEVGPIDFDVTTNSQGMEVKSVKVAFESRSEARATVAATLTPKGEWKRASPKDNIVRYDFIREDGRWKIDDVRSSDGDRRWSLRGLLNENLKS
jgi:Protein of unknown function (DUF3828)